MIRSVVVTGLGVIDSHGLGCSGLLEALRTGRPSLREVDRSDGFHQDRSSRMAALVSPDLDVTEWLPSRASRRLSMPSRFAVIAAKMACKAAGITVSGPDSSICLATSFGPGRYTQRLLDQVVSQGPQNASPYLFMECVANAPGAQIALALEMLGPNITITQRECGPLMAVARGAFDILSGRSSVAFVGAVDEIMPLTHSILDRFGALSREGGEKQEVARPFDRNRNGFVASEGATILVLEEESRAEARGAKILARVRHSIRGFDPTASSTGWGTGSERLSSHLMNELQRGGVTVESLGSVVSGASGSIQGDALEAGVLRGVFGKKMPPILAPKGVTGEYAGGQLASSLLALSGAKIGPSGGFVTPDPDLGVIPHPGGSLAQPDRILISSLSSGGAAAWLVLERP